MKKSWKVGIGIVLALVIGAIGLRRLSEDSLTSESAMRGWAKEITHRDPKIRQEAANRLQKARDPVGVCVFVLQMQPTRWEKLYATYAPKMLPKLPGRMVQRFPSPVLNDGSYRFGAFLPDA